MMVKAHRLWLIAMIAPVTLSSCAMNPLRIETARDVAGSAQVAVAATRSYLDTVEEARLRASLDVIGLDPNCVAGAYMLRNPKLTQVRDPRTPPRGWLCSATKRPDTNPVPLAVGPITPELEPTLALVEALGSYADAITKIVDQKDPDPGKDLTDAFRLARAAEDLLRVGIGGTAVLPAADDQRLAAVTGFINLIALLDRERDQVEKLRILTQEKETGALITAMRDHLANWELSRKTNANLSYVIAGLMYGRSSQIDPPLPAATRRDYADAYFAASEPLISSAKLQPALDRSLAEVADADVELRDTLASNPRLTDKQKQRLSELTRERLITVFNSLTKLLTAAKGF